MYSADERETSYPSNTELQMMEEMTSSVNGSWKKLDFEVKEQLLSLEEADTYFK